MSSKPRVAMWLAVALAALLLAARMGLPEVARQMVNKRLAALDDYQGYISDIDIALWRGAYTIEGLSIDKLSGDVPVPFVRADTIDLSVSWRALLRGAVVADIDFYALEVNFVDDRNKETQTGQNNDWREVVTSLSPIRINNLTVHNGALHFRNFNSEPPVNLVLSELNLSVRNINNTDRSEGSQQASIEGSGQLLDHAPIEIFGILDPLGDYRNFDIRLKVSDLNLRRANTLARAYGNFDFHSGQGSFLMDLEAVDGKLEGYAKPLLDEVEILDEEEQNGLWETVVAAFGWLMRNHEEDRIGAQINISGDLNDSNVSAWQAFVSILRNAFVEAYEARFQQEDGA